MPKRSSRALSKICLRPRVGLQHLTDFNYTGADSWELLSAHNLSEVMISDFCYISEAKVQVAESRAAASVHLPIQLIAPPAVMLSRWFSLLNIYVQMYMYVYIYIYMQSIYLCIYINIHHKKLQLIRRVDEYVCRIL